MRWLERFSHLSWLQRTNRVLLAGGGICLLYTGVLVIMPSRLAGLAARGSVESAYASSRGKTSVRQIALVDVTGRNLFRPLIVPAPKVQKIAMPIPSALPPPPKIPLSQRMSHYRLVGIMNTDPLQAMIEDQSNQKTLYLIAGQPLEDAQVEKILADQVILVSGDERFNLAM
jgi:hypothetical protein